MSKVSEIDTDFIQTVADKLGMALEAEGEQLMILSADLAEGKIIGGMVQAGLSAIDRLADSEIRAAQLGA